MDNLVYALCAQGFDNDQEEALVMRIVKNKDDSMSLNVVKQPAHKDFKSRNIEKLNNIIIAKLLSVGEHIPIINSPEHAKMRMAVEINKSANDIARITRRGSGNVIIAHKQFIDSITSICGPFPECYQIFENENVPDNTCIVLYRVRSDNPWKINCDGSPIILIDKNPDFTKEINYGWAGEEAGKDYVKILYFKE